MSKSLAPRSSRGSAWMGLWCVLGLLVPELSAQPSKTAAPKADGAPATKGADAAAKGATPARPPVGADGEIQGGTPTKKNKEIPPAESFKDPNAEKALPNTFKQLGTRPSQQVRSQVRAMARGESPPVQSVLERYVDGEVFELTSNANIKAMLDPGAAAGTAAARGIETATANLLDPLNAARGNNNAGFLNAYNQVLLNRLPRLLDNHLLSRIEAMIVLGQTRSPNAIDLYLKQLADPNQTVWVKLWAARGLTNVTQGGQTDLDTQRAMTASRGVADLLEREKELPWPVQMRALEALGSLRQSSSTPLQGKGDLATVAMRFLADPEARPAVRAWAAWALGLLRVSPQLRYNYSVVAYNVGLLAVDLGTRIEAGVTDNPEQAQFFTGLLLYQVNPSLVGQAGVRDSGLLNAPNVGAHRAFIQQVADRVQAVCVSSVNLMRAAGGLIPQRRKELAERVAALRAFLDSKAAPADRKLLPDGPEFPPAAGAGVARGG